MGEVVKPAYERNSLADLLPSICDGLKVPGAFDILGLGPAERVAVLLVDGLGARQVQENEVHLPFVAAAMGKQLTSVFPSTTVAALTSLGRGQPPLEHGLVSTAFLLEDGEVLKALNWGHEPPVHEVIAGSTWWERADAAGVSVRISSPRRHASGGLTHAAFAGGTFVGADTAGERSTEVRDGLAKGRRSLVYGYWDGLDRTAHVHGTDSAAYRDELDHVDVWARHVVESAPSGSRIFLTADHGVVNATDVIELERTDPLLSEVHLAAGEPRVRHLYTRPGATSEVLARWQESLGHLTLVMTRDQALEEGWFGGTPSGHEHRLGDVIVAARDRTRISLPQFDRGISGLPGQHGSFTSDEMEIPLAIWET